MDQRRIRINPRNFEAWIVYEDDDLLCINKPQGLHTLKDRLGLYESAVDLARRYHTDLTPCHRLDQLTSGVLLFAKHDEAYRHIALQFRKRRTEKHYRALISLPRHFEDMRIELPIGVSSKGVARIDPRDGKYALTIVNTETMYRNYTLLDCQPVTGRQHQIRIHLAHLRMPLTGDELYGGKHLWLSELKRNYKPSRYDERPLNTGFVLHAHRLTITHPRLEAPVTFEAPYSDNLAVCLKILDKYDA